MSTADIIGQLNQAKELAFSSKESFPQVLRHIFNFALNPNVEIQRWCAEFLCQSFKVDETKLAQGDKIELAIDSIDSLVTLTNVKDIEVFKSSVEAVIIVYKLVFRYVADNDGCQDVWNKLGELKSNLISKFQNSFPFDQSSNEEINQMKNIRSRLELVRFLIIVIDYQSKSAPNVKSFSVLRVNPNHTLIKQSAVENECHAILDLLLKVLKQDILVTPLVTATLNHLVIVCKRKPQFISKILTVVESFESENKLQSNYESLETFKLAKKYADRVLRIFINHLLRNQLVPANFQSSLNKKLNALIARGDDIRRKNILLPNPDTDIRIRKRKFDGFYNLSKKLKTVDYKNLYCLNEPDNELNNFNLSSLPQHILISMTLAALNKVETNKLVNALDIIAARYRDAVSGAPTAPAPAVKGAPEAYEVKKLENEDDEDEDDDKVGLNYNPQTVYNLPPPVPLSMQEKKENLNLIIKNFFKLGQKEVEDLDESKEDDKQLTKVAIKSWLKDSWLILLTRLATRGMRSVDGSESYGNELRDMIRTSIFDHFLDNIHTRIDLIIEWLNEEWYSEKVFNEEQLTEKLTQEAMKEYEESSNKNEIDLQQKIQEKLTNMNVETPVYNKWAGKVLDAMIPFLEPGDRKIFIRLLSDLPYLDEDLVSRIKSLCYDPGRVKIGFLSLQFLVMYRPPVKQFCINILKELAESDQEDLKEQSQKLLDKYLQ